MFMNCFFFKGYLEIFQTNNALLDQIQHALASYLETKRSNFPR